METYNNQYNNVVVKDGHVASFRNIDGSLKNIYTDDGSLTEEGKEVMAARGALSQSNEGNKKRKSKRKQIAWAISAAVIVFIALGFHIAPEYGMIFPKDRLTFSNTFITSKDVNDVIRRYNNASIFERYAIEQEPLVRKLLEKGMIGREE